MGPANIILDIGVEWKSNSMLRVESILLKPESSVVDRATLHFICQCPLLHAMLVLPSSSWRASQDTHVISSLCLRTFVPEATLQAKYGRARTVEPAVRGRISCGTKLVLGELPTSLEKGLRRLVGLPRCGRHAEARGRGKWRNSEPCSGYSMDTASGSACQ